MRIAIVGSRGIQNYDLKKHIPPDTTLIVSGGVTGVDMLAEKYADEHGIEKLIFKPEYQRYGKSAPLIRNKMIVDSVDLVIAIWDGSSAGTRFTIDYAKRRGVPCEIYMCLA